MALPTCACVASLPPMQRWAAIAAMAQTWAGEPVTPIACARTFNEILNDLYCALLTVSEGCTTPTLVSATIVGTTLTLVFSEEVTGEDGFTGFVDGVPATFTYQSGSGSTTYALQSDVAAEEGETVTLDYVPGDIENNGCPLLSISDFAVENNTGLQFFYLRPDGVSRYLRPDGVSFYLRP